MPLKMLHRYHKIITSATTQIISLAYKYKALITHEHGIVHFMTHFIVLSHFFVITKNQSLSYKTLCFLLAKVLLKVTVSTFIRQGIASLNYSTDFRSLSRLVILMLYFNISGRNIPFDIPIKQIKFAVLLYSTTQKDNIISKLTFIQMETETQFRLHVDQRQYSFNL